MSKDQQYLAGDRVYVSPRYEAAPGWHAVVVENQRASGAPGGAWGRMVKIAPEDGSERARYVHPDVLSDPLNR